MRGWLFVFFALTVVTGWLVFGVSRQVPTLYHVLFSLSVVSFIIVGVYLLARQAARDIEHHMASGTPADPVERSPEHEP